MATVDAPGNHIQAQPLLFHLLLDKEEVAVKWGQLLGVYGHLGTQEQKIGVRRAGT